MPKEFKFEDTVWIESPEDGRLVPHAREALVSPRLKLQVLDRILKDNAFTDEHRKELTYELSHLANNSIRTQKGIKNITSETLRDHLAILRKYAAAVESLIENNRLVHERALLHMGEALRVASGSDANQPGVSMDNFNEATERTIALTVNDAKNWCELSAKVIGTFKNGADFPEVRSYRRVFIGLYEPHITKIELMGTHLPQLWEKLTGAKFSKTRRHYRGRTNELLDEKAVKFVADCVEAIGFTRPRPETVVSGERRAKRRQQKIARYESF